MRKVFLMTLLLAVAFTASAGCGKKAPPRPPEEARAATTAG